MKLGLLPTSILFLIPSLVQSSPIPFAAPVPQIWCNVDIGQIYCNTKCCDPGSKCVSEGVCSSSGDSFQQDGYWYYWTSTWVESTNAVITHVSTYSTFTTMPTGTPGVTVVVPPTTTYVPPPPTVIIVTATETAPITIISDNPPSRPTGNTRTITAITSTVYPSSTFTGIVAPGQTGGGPHLSGGQIAGIVIGVIFGIILLLLLCCCLCVGGLASRIWGGLTGRNKQHGGTTVVTESVSEHGEGHSSGAKKGIIAALIGLFLARKLKKNHDDDHGHSTAHGTHTETTEVHHSGGGWTHKLRNLLGLGALAGAAGAAAHHAGHGHFTGHGRPHSYSTSDSGTYSYTSYSRSSRTGTSYTGSSYFSRSPRRSSRRYNRYDRRARR